ncbi:MobQ family relaxase [Aerococcus mictus]|nr:MobQ family relaxase [Aerococcus mictus]MCY3076768.1 MobA/MobL family protein [Aerococcus mictus]
MADSFHFSVNIISRGKGKSAVASAAYISGEKIKNEWDGVTHDYTKKQGVISKEIFLPDHAPKEYKDRKTLWNSVELFEKNSNAQLARNFIISLPKELSIEENKKMIEEYIQTNFVKEGMIVDLAIHDENREGNQNIHAHIMTIVRPINEDGTWGQKSKKEYILNEKGEKILNKNGKPKTRKVELTSWNDKGNVEKWRENFSDLCNEYLAKNKIEKRVDHRSFKRQNSDYLPTIHLGSAASAMERKGIETDKGNYNREIRKYNNLVKTIKEEIKTLKGWIGNLLDNLTTAYEKFKDIERDKVIDNPKLFNLTNYLLTYSEIQKEKSKYLKGYAKTNKEKYDFKKLTSAYSYLRKNNIETIGQLQTKIETLKSNSYKINKKAKTIHKEMEDVEKKILYYEIYKAKKEVYEEYQKKNIFTKDTFYNKHKKDIDQYKVVREKLKKLLSDKEKLSPKKWNEEKNLLMAKLEEINKEKDKIKDEYQEINHIKYSVDFVNKELGIDLSIEIDKLIKQGEKPSVIAQIKKFQDQVNKDNEYREMMKNKKMDQER